MPDDICTVLLQIHNVTAINSQLHTLLVWSGSFHDQMLINPLLISVLLLLLFKVKFYV